VDPARLLAAACEALAPAAAGLQNGARQALAAESGDVDAARTFSGLLESAYVVASADGMADAERHALAELLERVTGQAVDRATLETHFADIDAACAVLGRRERLRRAAADLTGIPREALGFSAVVALTDGELGEPELEALIELGAHLELDRDS
jgi:hypothetical protein